MATVFTKISAALDGHLNTMTGKPAIAWPNDDYAPVIGTLYARPTNLAGDFGQITLGSSGQDRVDGIYQVDIFSPSGKGKLESMTMADLIADRFKRGTNITYSGLTLRIRGVSGPKNAINEDNGWFHTFIEITYRANTEART